MERKLIVFLLAGMLVGAGAGYLISESMGTSGDPDDTYWFYLYFSDGDARNKWYSAEAPNTNEGFGRAMENAGMKWEKSPWGYISTIDGDGGNDGWFLCQYIYSSCSAAAAGNSIVAPDQSATGVLHSSNGWYTIYGYDDGGFKLGQFSSHIYFFSIYYTVAGGYFAESPVSKTTWMNSGPFA